MKFYTNIEQARNRILVRGYENGQRVQYQVNYNPSLYVVANKKTDHKSLDGRYLKEVRPGSMNDCRQFINQYEGIEEFEIHGNTRYLYQYINEAYPTDEIDYDTSLIRTFTLDIEMELRMVSLTLKQQIKRYFLFLSVILLQIGLLSGDQKVSRMKTDRLIICIATMKRNCYLASLNGGRKIPPMS